MLVWLNEKNRKILQARYPCDNCEDGLIDINDIECPRKGICPKCRASQIDIKAAGIVTHRNQKVAGLRQIYSYHVYEERFKKEGLSNEDQ
jgi:hypothetical protein